MQLLGEAILDWVEGDEGEFVFPSFEDGAWTELERGVLSFTALASCMGNGRMLSTIYWEMTTVRVTTTRIFVVIQKWQFKLF